MGRKSAWLSVDKIIASCAKGFCRKTLSAFLEIGSSSPLQMPHLNLHPVHYYNYYYFNIIIITWTWTRPGNNMEILPSSRDQLINFNPFHLGPHIHHSLFLVGAFFCKGKKGKKVDFYFSKQVFLPLKHMLLHFEQKFLSKTLRIRMFSKNRYFPKSSLPSLLRMKVKGHHHHH